MTSLSLSEQSEKEQAKIQLLAFFLSICLCAVLSLCFILIYRSHKYSNERTVLYSKINPNVDTAVSMARLPSLGATKAGAIVEYRQNGKNFKNADDLDNVKGIGPKTIENIRPYLEFKSK